MAFDKRLKTKRGIEQIKAYIIDRSAQVDLTQNEKDLLDDLQWLDRQFMFWKTKTQVVHMYLGHRERNGRAISLATAYNHFNYMQQIFGPLYRDSKEYSRAFMIQWAQKVMIKSEKAEDYRSFSQMFKQLKELMKLDDPDEIPMEILLNPVPYEFGYSPELETRKLDGKKIQELEDKYLKKYSEEIAFEELKDDE